MQNESTRLRGEDSSLGIQVELTTGKNGYPIDLICFVLVISAPSTIFHVEIKPISHLDNWGDDTILHGDRKWTVEQICGGW